MNVEAERERLEQIQGLKWVQQNYGAATMVPVYLSTRQSDVYHHGILGVLVSADQMTNILHSPYWDLTQSAALPEIQISPADDESRGRYVRFGRDDGIEPVVIHRDFHGIRDSYWEINEEFRLFHNLFHDRKTDQYLKIDRAGHEHVIVKMEPEQIQIRLKELRQFMAVKQMYLSLQFDFTEFSPHSLETLGLEVAQESEQNDLACWRLNWDEYPGLVGRPAFSRLVGKRLIAPYAWEKGLEALLDERTSQYVEFIIGVDENGDEITHTADPDSVRFMDVVFFRREVLEKYYEQPGKYDVDDSMLSCGRLWSMQIDTYNKDYVLVWLGDLGRNLPYEEMHHWRAHNIIPPETFSDIYFRRQIEAPFIDAARPEEQFRYFYEHLADVCDRRLGWQLLLPLESEDKHHYRAIRLPAVEEQRLFDELILALTKILIDSLNEKQLLVLIPPDERKEKTGSIARLEAVLQQIGVLNEEGHQHVAFLRSLQKLRSTGSAHRKGSRYRKVATTFGLESQTVRDTFSNILGQAIHFLDYLIEVVESGRLNRSES